MYAVEASGAQPMICRRTPYTLPSSDHNITQLIARLNSGSPGLCKGQRNEQKAHVQHQHQHQHPIGHLCALSLLDRAMLNVTDAFTTYCSLAAMDLISWWLCGFVLLGVYCCIAICHHLRPRKLKRTRSKSIRNCFQVK